MCVKYVASNYLDDSHLVCIILQRQNPCIIKNKCVCYECGIDWIGLDCDVWVCVLSICAESHIKYLIDIYFAI